MNLGGFVMASAIVIGIVAACFSDELAGIFFFTAILMAAVIGFKSGYGG